MNHNASRPVWLNDDWYFDATRNILRKDGMQYEMEHQLFVLLDYFVQREQQVLGKDRLITDNWPGKVVNEDSLTVAISKLRKVFGEQAKQPTLIKTIPGIGYQFIASVRQAEDAAPEAIAKARRRSILKAWPLFAAVLLMSWLALPWLLQEPEPMAQPQQDAGVTADITPLQRLIQQSEQAERSQIPDLLDKWRNMLLQDPELVQGYWHLAWLKIRLLGNDLPEQPQHFAELNALLQRVVALEPGHAEAWSWLARIHFWHRSDYAQSAAYFEQALQLKEDANFYYAYGEMLLAHGQFEATFELANRALQMLPHLYAFPGMAWAYQLSGHTDEAWRELQRIGQTERQTKMWHCSALRISYELGLYEHTFQSLQWLLQQSDEGRRHLHEVTKLYQTEGMPAVFGYLLAHEFTDDIGHYRPPLSWARYAILTGDLETAEQLFQQAAALRQIPLLWAAVDPVYAPLHQSPVFTNWLQSIQLSETMLAR
ncbi:winged helix-turn-helix domain-containing protein [Alkalimonas amylolytica]|uniref:DNA-binding winged helix-turn-helix (WHTH) domain-containing protein n=1 Tax=Alkalimonas amylolytica TaxID=152573 RepID=A0A1H4EJ76_ALKAM|nr:winged helix-turn-helix domain-containing protein [Alkalimonas amylolytica]SEA85065.1 DNA-binding winged helix-turn-helix (wHTH) domain-containing protein [Alkalimonas amylolytica]